MPRVIHFEVHADKPERAVKFYEDAFGWKVKKWEGPVDYWLVTTGEDKHPRINGAIMQRVNKGTVYNMIDVPSVDEFIKKIVKLTEKSYRRRQPSLE
jgi:predicted enzyme related to lactoylglutathione lyase